MSRLETKRGARHLERQYIALLKFMWRRCFWTRPLGHDYSYVYSGVTCCRYCLKPRSVRWGSRSKLAVRHKDLRSVFGVAQDQGLIEAEWPT